MQNFSPAAPPCNVLAYVVPNTLYFPTKMGPTTPKLYTFVRCLKVACLNSSSNPPKSPFFYDKRSMFCSSRQEQGSALSLGAGSAGNTRFSTAVPKHTVFALCFDSARRQTLHRACPGASRCAYSGQLAPRRANFCWLARQKKLHAKKKTAKIFRI